jgi:(p)ppGpp synthase/HD superfamily hydrolase
MSCKGFSSRFDEALVYASDLHRDQARKGNGFPYVSHLLSVTGIVIENGGDEDTAIAALLHDSVEDQGGEATLNQIRQRWGDCVAGIVRECSDNEGEPKRPWAERKRDFVATIPRLTPGARLVALADKLHNIRCVVADYRQHGDSVWSRFNGGRDGTLWYYQAAVAAFREAGNEPLLQELSETVDQLISTAGERDGQA